MRKRKMELTRRNAILTGAAAVAALALPALPAAAEHPIKAMMLYTEDEPWGVFVQGHVSPEQFRAASLAMIEQDRDARENGEDWFFESDSDDEGERSFTVKAEGDHGYMRMTGEVHRELGFTYRTCKEGDPGAFPVTMALY